MVFGESSVSRSVLAGLQIFICSGYNFCHPGEHTDRQLSTSHTIVQAAEPEISKRMKIKNAVS